jgi:GTPase SAR1 family protein
MEQPLVQIAVLGDGGVGKSSLIKSLARDEPAVGGII